MWNTVSKTEIVESAFYVHQGWKLTPTLSILFQIQKVICYRLRSGLCVCVQSCPTLCNPIDYSLPDSSVHGILQARTLEWVAISSSRGSSWPRDRTQIPCIAGRRFTLWATREAEKLNKWVEMSKEYNRRFIMSIGWHSFGDWHAPTTCHL